MRNSEVDGATREWMQGEGAYDDAKYEPEDAAPPTKKKRLPSDRLATAKKAGAAVISGIRKAGQIACETAPKVGKAIQTTRETATKYAPAHPSGHPSASSPFTPSQGAGIRGGSPMGGFGGGIGMTRPEGHGIFGGMGSVQRPEAPPQKGKKKKKGARLREPIRDHGIFSGMHVTSRPEQFVGPVRSKAKKPKW